MATFIDTTGLIARMCPASYFYSVMIKMAGSGTQPLKIQVITHSCQEEEMCLVTWDCTRKNHKRSKRSVISLGAGLELSDLDDIVRPEP